MKKSQFGPFQVEFQGGSFLVGGPYDRVIVGLTSSCYNIKSQGMESQSLLRSFSTRSRIRGMRAYSKNAGLRGNFLSDPYTDTIVS